MHEYIGLTGFCFKLISPVLHPSSQSIIRSPYLAIGLAKVQEGRMRCSVVLPEHPAPAIPRVVFLSILSGPSLLVLSPFPVLSFPT